MGRLGLVLDIETGPDRALLARKGLHVHVAAGRSWLHELTSYAVLEFAEDEQANISEIKIDSGCITSKDPGVLVDSRRQELAALLALEQKISRTGDHPFLITFNGIHHDVPFIRRRISQICGNRYYSDCFTAAGTNWRHFDMMHLCRQLPSITDKIGRNRWPSLIKACEAVGIPHRPHRQVSRTFATVRKCETDVIATFLLYLLWRAGGDTRAWSFNEGWVKLAIYCLKTPALHHRTEFAFAPSARLAFERIEGTHLTE